MHVDGNCTNILRNHYPIDFCFDLNPDQIRFSVKSIVMVEVPTFNIAKDLSEDNSKHPLSFG